MIVGLLVAGASLLLARRRVRKTIAAALLVVVVIGVPAAPFLTHWLARGENTQGLEDLSGRTNSWSAVLSVHRPTTNVIFGSGLSNDAVNGSSNPAMNGLPIDSSWISIYQDQGIFGDVLVAIIFVLLLLTALYRARGPTRALALFLIVYCLIAGINESGLGGVSPYLLDLTVAASLLSFPSGERHGPDLQPRTTTAAVRRIPIRSRRCNDKLREVRQRRQRCLGRQRLCSAVCLPIPSPPPRWPWTRWPRSIFAFMPSMLESFSGRRS